MDIGVPELLLLVLLGLFYGIPIWAAVDLLLRPRQSFEAVGRSKTLWLVLVLLSLPFSVGLVVALPYLVWVRPRVARGALLT